MSKHTKGPWRAVGSTVYFPNSLGGFCIQSCPDSQENARLIAAAPELLEIVIDLLDAFGEGDSEIENDARAIIAKATGEQA